MPSSPNYFTQMLPGQITFILGAAALLAFPISFLLLRLYRRAVLKSMERKIGGTEDLFQVPETPSVPPSQPSAPLQIISLQEHEKVTLSPEAQSHYNGARRSPWQAAAVYALGGVCYALVMAVAMQLAWKTTLSPGRLAMLASIFVWPLFLTLILVVGSTPRLKLLLVLAYFIGYIILGAVNVARNPEFTFREVFQLWLIFNAIPTALVLAYLTRKIRAVGPLVLTFLVAAFTGAVYFVQLFSIEYLLRLLVRLGVALGIGGNALFIGSPCHWIYCLCSFGMAPGLVAEVRL